MIRLGDKLQAYARGDYYPFHMPGHKRNPSFVSYNPSVETDITEIDGFDNLHQAEGILLEAQKRASGLFGVKDSYYSINGSTGALLAAISACTTIGGKLLMARNCHKAVYHCAYLRQLTPVYLYPERDEVYGLSLGVDPKAVKAALEEDKSIEVVVITSPTYDGVVSPIEEICEMAHGYGVPVIVDEAHGAHFIFHKAFPTSATSQGADIIIHSLHKTLPSMTQTSLLHYNSILVSKERIERYMAIYQSSSPSYPLMASIDGCICDLIEKGEDRFRSFIELLEGFYKETENLQYIEVAGKALKGKDKVYQRDFSKILLSINSLPMTASEFYTILLDTYHLQMEMDSCTYVLGIASVADTREGFARLSWGLHQIEKNVSTKPQEEKALAFDSMDQGEVSIPLWKAMDMTKIYVPLENSRDYICGDFVSLYPPGIPILVPGERISSEKAAYIQRCQAEGLFVQGLREKGMIGVIDE